MNRLTHKRVNGIKSGYWSPAKKDELTARLGPIEELGHGLLERACNELCLYSGELTTDELEVKCELCPLVQLDELIQGVEG